MTSYTDESRYQTTMSNSDLNLYSSNEDWPMIPATSDAGIPVSSFLDDSYTMPTTNMEQQSFSMTRTQDFGFNVDPANLHLRAATLPYSPAASPANSISHSFDVQPPHLSAASESGASIQSTTSSAMGSPSLRPHYQESWPDYSQSVGMVPSMLQKDFGQDQYLASSVEFDSIISADKLPIGCVGESPSSSSSSVHPESFHMRSFSADSASPSLARTVTSGMPTSQYGTSKGNLQFALRQNSPAQQRAIPRSVGFPDSHSSSSNATNSLPCEMVSFRKNGSDSVEPRSFSYPALTFEANFPFQIPSYTQMAITSPRFAFTEPPPSPCPSNTSTSGQTTQRLKSPRSQSPYLQAAGFQPYPQYSMSRRPSISSIYSHHSQNSKASRRSGSYEADDDHREKDRCPIPECGRVFKDLKAHMLTHQTERPEKCPIQTCEYHIKGFARKYDKNRHTLTHYKGTMVCGFCPGSGSSAEKSFNRADVFKRHLTSVHNVEQTPPNSRRKSPQSKKAQTGQQQHSEAGTCSTCDVTFSNVQDFYEHLDDCVLRVVQQIDPAEDINHKLLSSVNEDKAVKETMERNCLSTDLDMTGPTSFEDEEEDEDSLDDLEDAIRTGRNTTTSSSRRSATKLRKDSNTN